MVNSPKLPLLEALQNEGDAEQAETIAGYLKTSRLSFMGVKIPMISRITKKHMKGLSLGDLHTLMTNLWKEPFFETRRAAIDIMKEFVKKAEFSTSLEIIDRWIDDIDTWALMDPLGSNCLGDLLLREPSLEKTLVTWSTDENFWRRRASILPYLYLSLKKRYSPEFNKRILAAIKPHIGDKEFFVGKAAGWGLRELSKRDPEVVAEFYEKNREKMTPLVVREGYKKL
ncbi:MAG: DNA alkylation repair protein [Candidatus Thorarchaeota archaeon]|nr:DNA alkylation repair protein [Candidatus Thorarchaeota archaeon]